MKTCQTTKEMILFLRYHDINPNKPKKTYMRLKHIARLIGRSITYVHDICKLCLKLNKP